MSWQDEHRRLRADGWRRGRDGLWRNDRFGGSYKRENAILRIGSMHGEITHHPFRVADSIAFSLALNLVTSLGEGLAFVGLWAFFGDRRSARRWINEVKRHGI